MDYLTHRWTNLVNLFYTTYIRVDLAHHEIVRAKVGKGGISNSYTMGCPPVRLTYRWTNMVNLFHTTYINVDLAHHEISW